MTLTDKRGEQGKGGAESLQALSVTLLFFPQKVQWNPSREGHCRAAAGAGATALETLPCVLPSAGFKEFLPL